MSNEQPQHASYVYLLDETGAIEELPHPLYVALVRSETSIAKLAGKRFRLADWYVAMNDGKPAKVVREWYGWVAFDEQGNFHPEGGSPNDGGGSGRNVDASALSTPEEHDRLIGTLFKRE